MISRWCIIKPNTGDLVQHALGAQSARVKDELPGGWLLVEAEWDGAGFENMPAFIGTVLPSLTAPGSSAPAVLAAFLTQYGVALGAGDDIQQALRKLRDARGKQFSVDKPF